MAKTDNTEIAAPEGFAVVEGGLPTSSRVRPEDNPFHEAVLYSKQTGQTLSVPVTDMKRAHQQLRRAASALDVGIKIRPAVDSDEGKNATDTNPVPVSFKVGPKRGAGSAPAEDTTGQ